MTKSIDLVYIAGSGRSGTTLLELLLSSLDDVFSCGELMYIWDRSIQGNELCGCGKPVVECDEWKEIFLRAKHYDLDIFQNYKQAIFLRDKYSWIKKVPFWHSNSYKKYAEKIIQKFLYPLYMAIRDVRNESIIVDSSKNAGYLYLLTQCEFINLRVLHMFRDSRAVAHSWQRKKKRLEIVGKDVYMPQINPYYSSVQWLFFNTLIRRILKNQNNIIINYDKLTKSPLEELERIINFLSIENSINYTDNKFFIKNNHTVSGNPIRIKAKDVRIRHDDSWIHKMKKHEKLIIKMATWPLLKKYCSPV